MKIVTKMGMIIFITMQFCCGSEPQTNNKVNVPDTAITTGTGAGKTEEKGFADIHFASKFDTSCGMPLTAGIADTLHLNDKIYGFCSEGCKDEFANKLIAEKKR